MTKYKTLINESYWPIILAQIEEVSDVLWICGDNPKDQVFPCPGSKAQIYLWVDVTLTWATERHDCDIETETVSNAVFVDKCMEAKPRAK